MQKYHINVFRLVTVCIDAEDEKQALDMVDELMRKEFSDYSYSENMGIAEDISYDYEIDNKGELK